MAWLAPLCPAQRRQRSTVPPPRQSIGEAEPLARLRKLHTLDLGGNRIEASVAAGLCELLRAGGGGGGGGGDGGSGDSWSAGGGTRSRSPLRALRLWGSPLDDSVAAAASALEGLRALELGWSRVGGEGLQVPVGLVARAGLVPSYAPTSISYYLRTTLRPYLPTTQLPTRTFPTTHLPRTYPTPTYISPTHPPTHPPTCLPVRGPRAGQQSDRALPRALRRHAAPRRDGALPRRAAGAHTTGRTRAHRHGHRRGHKHGHMLHATCHMLHCICTCCMCAPACLAAPQLLCRLELAGLALSTDDLDQVARLPRSTGQTHP